MQPLFLVFGIQLAVLFEHPAFSVGVVGWFIGGAVNLTRMIEYAVQDGWARIFPLTGFRATKSGLTAVSSALSPLLRRLCLLPPGLPLLSLASELP